MHQTVNLEQLLVNIFNLQENQDFPWKLERTSNTRVIATKETIDADSFTIFGIARTKETLKLFIDFDEESKTARYELQESSYSWLVGIPIIGWYGSSFRGQRWGIHTARAYGIGTDLKPKELYDYNISYHTEGSEIAAAVAESGWEWKRNWFSPYGFIPFAIAFLIFLGIFTIVFLATVFS